VIGCYHSFAQRQTLTGSGFFGAFFGTVIRSGKAQCPRMQGDTALSFLSS
jgi:hypothetical protein